ncbi:MAG TPA: hypothetical protein VGX91_03925 [Candidatus Cybelea sp.]|jgi:hypothetical protein|nr:hypothetical protein [Candidatus Cybelea sp.]
MSDQDKPIQEKDLDSVSGGYEPGKSPTPIPQRPAPGPTPTPPGRTHPGGAEPD